MSLSGKKALVTGGGTGVGAVIARSLAQAGASVIICGRSLDKLEAVAATHDAISAVQCDITDEAQVSSMFEAAGPLDIVVANAGASESAPFAKTSLDAFQRMLSVNLTGTFLTMREGLKAMKGRKGRMIVIASTAAQKGYAYVAPYAAAKHGALGLVRSVAQEYAAKDITVNAICPGFLDTEMTARTIDNIVKTTGRSEQDALAALTATNPMGKLVPPEDVAAAVLWLCAEGSDMVTGQAISVAGGEI
ncbi:SDR family oxidoreductase [Rhodobacteraceae bacterium RKSG542]|uniref:SDR family NAD(P)-dependent oxidoreductase n=1 Tax=Pseudovibrio flavus TaxID=2529854 RepID=UPI0012BD1D5A|nr:SDR family NAD(P)-dependent oxidoreductase [Pseudovibrio flavus]MTI16444.1 SDR family oxidoreductase [Pseudovibrio flavus]